MATVEGGEGGFSSAKKWNKLMAFEQLGARTHSPKKIMTQLNEQANISVTRTQNANLLAGGGCKAHSIK